MSKQISAEELADVVNRLLTNPESAGELDNMEKQQSFMTDIAKVVCDHCGGEVHTAAGWQDDSWYVGIRGNDSLPDDGGIWSGLDPEGRLFDSEDVCTECGASAQELIGTPSGKEICQDCFDRCADWHPGI